jgi:hypothetical protein
LNNHPPLTALVVHESMFGNTAAIAESVARGLELGGFEVTRTGVDLAPALEGVDVDLLVVGAPTHVFSLSRPSTRADAVRQCAPDDRARTGIREWLDGPPAPGDRVRLAAMFDTRVTRVRHLPTAAGTRGAHLLKRLGYTQLVRPEAFLVDDVQGPLVSGETLRAVTWGNDLAQACGGSALRPAAPSS